MKIDRVILSSDSHVNYLPFWEYAAKSWMRLGVKPSLFLVDHKNASKINVDTSIGDVYHFDCDEMHTAFASQNIRLLAPCLFPDEFVIIADIDSFPLSKKYFVDNIKDYGCENFICYRAGSVGPHQIAMPWNIAKGSTWSEIFEFRLDEHDWQTAIKKRLLDWYPVDYQSINEKETASWYTDQLLLRKYVSVWGRMDNFKRLVELCDRDTGFYRLDRDYDGDRHTTHFDPNNNYSDFSPPRPLHKHKEYIEKVLSHYNIN